MLTTRRFAKSCDNYYNVCYVTWYVVGLIFTCVLLLVEFIMCAMAYLLSRYNVSQADCHILINQESN